MCWGAMKNIEEISVEKQINMILFHCAHEWNSRKKIKENSYPPPTFSNDLRSKRKCLTFSCQYLFLKNLLFSQYYNHTIHVLINIAIWVSSSENERFCTRILWRTWGSWARPGTIAHQAKVPASELRIWCGLMGPTRGEPASTSCPPASAQALQQAPGG